MIGSTATRAMKTTMTRKRTTWAAQIAVVMLLLATGTAPASSSLLAGNSPRGKNSLEGSFHRAWSSVSAEGSRGWGEVCTGSAADSVVAPNAGGAVPKTGDLFERTFQTPKGPVGLLAETVVEGDTLVLKDVVVYGEGTTPLTGLTREALAARTQLIEEAKALGFKKLRITGQRIQSSSSGNPGHPIDITVDLTK